MKSILSSSIKSLIIGICFGIGVIGTAAIAVTVSATFNDGDTLSATSLNVLKTAVESIPVTDYIWIRDEKTSGTDGGIFTQDVWQKRDLNTEKSDAGGHATVSDNQIILGPGTYHVTASAPTFKAVGSHRIRLYNATDGSTLIAGQNAYSSQIMITSAFLRGQFTISETKNLELQHICEATLADGFGHNSAGYGEAEVYSVIELWRIGD